MTRIIGGSHRGHRLSMPKGDRTRPTTDRVREALFSALASWCGDPTGPPDQALAGVAFLDLYAGSGAVGLEAASRGAGPVVLVESDRRTALVASGNAKALGLAVSVRATKVETVIARAGRASVRGRLRRSAVRGGLATCSTATSPSSPSNCSTTTTG